MSTLFIIQLISSGCVASVIFSKDLAPVNLTRISREVEHLSHMKPTAEGNSATGDLLEYACSALEVADKLARTTPIRLASSISASAQMIVDPVLVSNI